MRSRAKGGYLVNAAAHAASLSSAVLLTIALALTSAGIAVVLWPVLRPLSERMALALAILGAAVVALAGLENASLLCDAFAQPGVRRGRVAGRGAL